MQEYFIIFYYYCSSTISLNLGHINLSIIFVQRTYFSEMHFFRVFILLSMD